LHTSIFAPPLDAADVLPVVLDVLVDAFDDEPELLPQPAIASAPSATNAAPIRVVVRT